MSTARDGIRNYLTGRALCQVPRSAEETELLLDAFTAEVLATPWQPSTPQAGGCPRYKPGTLGLCAACGDHHTRHSGPPAVVAEARSVGRTAALAEAIRTVTRFADREPLQSLYQPGLDMAAGLLEGIRDGAGQAPPPQPRDGWHQFRAVALPGCSAGGRLCTQHCSEPCDDQIFAESPVLDALNGSLNAALADLEPGSYLARINDAQDDVEIRPVPQPEQRCDHPHADAPGIRGLLEHVGIDTTGRDITVAGRVVDAAPQPVDGEEAANDAARRFARRLFAVERLCSGRPGYHTITVKALLTAMSDADEDRGAAPQPETAPDTEPGTPDGEPLSCRSDEGITVGLADALIAILRVLAPRDLSPQPVQEALADLFEDRDLRTVRAALRIAPDAEPGTPDNAQDDLRQRIDAAIRPNMLFGLQDAELYGEGGAERIGEWVTWITDAVVTVLAPRDTGADNLGTRRSQFLADAITAHGPGHQWRTGSVVKLFEAADLGDVCRNTGRRLLHTLEADGLLRRIDAASDRYWVPMGHAGGDA